MPQAASHASSRLSRCSSSTCSSELAPAHPYMQAPISSSCEIDALLACRYQGHISAALVLGGVDLNGPHLFTVRVLWLPRSTVHTQIPTSDAHNACCCCLSPSRFIPMAPQTRFRLPPWGQGASTPWPCLKRGTR